MNHNEPTNGSNSLEEELRQSSSRFLNAIKQAPVAMCVFRGKNHVVEMANAMMLELWGKTEEQVLDKPVFEGLPEAAGQGLEQLVDSVYHSGEKFAAFERPVYLPRNGEIELTYINFVYEPLREEDGTVAGIIAVATEVTPQVIARKKIEESEARFRNLIARSPIPMAVFKGPDHVIEMANEAMAERWGKKESEFVNRRLVDVIPEVKDQKFVALLNQVFASGQRYRENESPSYLALNDGIKTFYLDLEFAPLAEPDGRVTGVIATLNDVTEKVLARRRIEESEKRFRLLADFMPQHIWTADVHGNLNYYNKSVLDYSGLSIEQLNQDGWLQMVHPDDRDENVSRWMHSISTGDDFLFEHRFRKHTGEYRWQLSRAIAQRDEQGNIQVWVGTSTDIQDQKTFADQLEQLVKERTKELLQTNESLKKSEQRYHLMVEEVQDYAILYLNPEGTVENWNAGAEKIKGYKASEIIGKNFSNFYTETDRKNNLPQTLLKRARETGRAVQEGWRVRKDGTLFWASVVITAVHNSKNEVVGFSKVTHDLTDKKNADDKIKENAKQLEQKNADLEKMNKELQSFAYISSHDLQEPLRKIQTFATFITSSESNNLSDTGRDYFRRMQDAAMRMQTLIDDLLAYSRTNSAERNYELTNLTDIVELVKTDLREELQQKQATIEAGQLPAIRIIRFQFRQLLINLISNSLKFARPGEAPCIVIKAHIAPGADLHNPRLQTGVQYCHISVADNGIGFEQQFSERIFELFQRLHGRQKYQGTGIGLAIVKKIVENHNGMIEASGELNKGATFNIYLPVS